MLDLEEIVWMHLETDHYWFFSLILVDGFRFITKIWKKQK